MPINYQEGKVYKIYNTINDDIYVGSTTLKLCERMRDHRNCINSKIKKDRPLYQAIREYGIGNFFIELIEKCPCNDKDELRRKEGEYIRSLKPSLNRYTAGRTDHEYYIDNKDRALQDAKVRYVTNRSHILETVKKYSENNKEYIKAYRGEKITCECGCVFRKDGIPRHKRSAKHNQLMKDKLN